VTTLVVRAEQRHRAAWEDLYQGYAKFYQVQQTSEMRDRVWGWIHDQTHQVECFLAVVDQPRGAGERVVGLAHFREFARPLTATSGGYLDDLFVDPGSRGTGAAETLLAAVGEEARRRDWSVIRWMTAEDNHRARGFYDKVAQRTTWVTYDLLP